MVDEHVFVPMDDGVRIALTLMLPDSAPPWPALLEGFPYRKDDHVRYAEREVYERLRDEGDYAVCRADVRGTGSSEGVAAEEYAAREQEDLCAIIDWLAGRDWCNGAVGMFGTSYPGFNSIQTAVHRPPALKAIIPTFASDDRYTDDVHYTGGVRRALDSIAYPLEMVAMNALPPVPELAGDAWRELWEQRVNELQPWFGSLDEQNDGPFWRQGSLRPRYDRINAATLLVFGWADIYRNVGFRMYEHLTCPKKLIVGPWSHTSPNASVPGPCIDIVPEMIRWWDRWLRGSDNGVEDEPPICIYVQDSWRPAPDLHEVPGKWRFEREWPLERSRRATLSLAEAGRPHASGAYEQRDTLPVRGDVGVSAHGSGAYGPPYGLPLDQRRDEAHALVYDWAVERTTEVLGTPLLEATIRSSVPVAYLAAKLSSVWPDGTSTLFSRGLLNLTHRHSHTHPEALQPGHAYDVRLPLEAASCIIPAGHRIRLAIAGSDWPNAWPPPEASELTVDVEQTRLVLPWVEGEVSIAERPTFAPVHNPPFDEQPTLAQEAGVWRIEEDVYRRETQVILEEARIDTTPQGWRTRFDERGALGVRPDEPGSAWLRARHEFEIAWPEATVRTVVRGHLRSDRTTYDLVLDLDVFEDEQLRWTRRWSYDAPRDHQ